MASIRRTKAFRLARSVDARARVRETTATRLAGKMETAAATAYVATDRGTFLKPVDATTMTAIKMAAPSKK